MLFGLACLTDIDQPLDQPFGGIPDVDTCAAIVKPCKLYLPCSEMNLQQASLMLQTRDRPSTTSSWQVLPEVPLSKANTEQTVILQTPYAMARRKPVHKETYIYYSTSNTLLIKLSFAQSQPDFGIVSDVPA